MRREKRFLPAFALALLLALLLPLAGCGQTSATAVPEEQGIYTEAADVAAYLRAFGHLPDNYLTKDEAFALG